MGISSLQVCIDSSDHWLQGTIHEDNNNPGIITTMDSTSPISPQSEDILTCSRPLIERRLRPPHEQSLKCPRCESTHTKFCYYNNYSLSQPRYFCKTCRRYWTKGGTLRNIPVGGGCRKNKKHTNSGSKKSSNDQSAASSNSSSLVLENGSGLASPPALTYHHNNLGNVSVNGNSYNQTDLQLAFPEQMHFSSLHGGTNLFTSGSNHRFLLDNNQMLPIDFMESNKYEGLINGGTSHDFMGNNGENFGGLMNNFNGICSSFGNMSSNFDHHQNHHHGIVNSSNNYNILESYQRLMVPNDENHGHHHYMDHQNDHHHVEVQQDVKPNGKILSLEWNENQQQACNSDAGKESYGYNFGGLGSWTGLMNGYGPSASGPLV